MPNKGSIMKIITRYLLLLSISLNILLFSTQSFAAPVLCAVIYTCPTPRDLNITQQTMSNATFWQASGTMGSSSTPPIEMQSGLTVTSSSANPVLSGLAIAIFNGSTLTCEYNASDPSLPSPFFTLTTPSIFSLGIHTNCDIRGSRFCCNPW